MAGKDNLRQQRTGTVINNTSEKREGKAAMALGKVMLHIINKFGIKLEHESNMFLKNIVIKLKKLFPDVDFNYYFDTSSMRPDGGILYMVTKNEQKYPILITEMKNQGTNDLRLKEGKKKQAKGNAIERLGKNVIGFRTAL